jgi:hypothetical protein
MDTSFVIFISIRHIRHHHQRMVEELVVMMVMEE